MIRRIIKIDADRCDGCGLCAKACHEHAIDIVNGKAVLVKDDYCDGLGDCLPACPMDAIHFEEREAAPYDEKAVEQRKRGQAALRQWPVQLKLVSPSAPFFQGCDLLIAADCTAYACGSFHDQYMKDRVTLIGCTKLDDADYSDKLAEIFKISDIRSIHVARMVVPCCRGMEITVRSALEKCGKDIPLEVTIIPIP